MSAVSASFAQEVSNIPQGINERLLVTDHDNGISQQAVLSTRNGGNKKGLYLLPSRKRASVVSR